jgi:acetyl-CoA decarbonylase/synthase complex subunit beta
MIKVPEGKIIQLPLDPEELFDDLPVDISPRWASERVRKNDTWVELGGPKHDYKSFIVTEICDLEDITPGKVEIVGPDLDELEEGTTLPFGYYMKLAGKELHKDYEAFFERWAIDNHTRIEGVMYLNMRDTVWMRLHKRLRGRVDSFKFMPQAVLGMFMAQMPLVEAIEAKIILGTEEIGGKELMAELVQRDGVPLWEARDAKVLEMTDEDVDTFFGCTLCQSFAPNQCCVISPERTPFCGVINWDNIRVGVDIDPQGYSFVMPKGECVDPVLGVYTGVLDTIYERSNRTLEKINMYSAIKYPMTT